MRLAGVVDQLVVHSGQQFAATQRLVVRISARQIRPVHNSHFHVPLIPLVDSMITAVP